MLPSSMRAASTPARYGATSAGLKPLTSTVPLSRLFATIASPATAIARPSSAFSESLNVVGVVPCNAIAATFTSMSASVVVTGAANVRSVKRTRPWSTEKAAIVTGAGGFFVEGGMDAGVDDGVDAAVDCGMRNRSIRSMLPSARRVTSTSGWRTSTRDSATSPPTGSSFAMSTSIASTPIAWWPARSAIASVARPA